MTSWEVTLLEEVDRWYCTLDRETTGAVSGAIDLLEQEGPTLGRPVVDRIIGSKFHDMKELRPSGTTVRILFIFDSKRRAVLLLAGDKQGNWKDWYDENVPAAEERYERWLASESGGA